jgi:15-cis-phytoene synthase
MPLILDNKITNEIVDTELLQKSFQYCKRITKEYAKSFYLATQFLSYEKRLATYALYGYCRFTDNIADDMFLSDDEKRFKLNKWKNKVYNALEKGYSEHALLNAFIKTVYEYGIDPKYPLELIEGMEMDLNQNRYENYAELQRFCYLVASVVGLMMSEVLGYKDKSALSYALKMGEAMQITNILRDIKEDNERGRIYLCQEDLERFNYSEKDLQNSVINEEFISLMEYYMEIAETLYHEGNVGIPLLEKKSQFAIIAASETYSGIIKEIRKANYDVYSSRIHVSKSKKIRKVLSAYVRTRLS